MKSLSLGDSWRECQNNDCNGRCRNGRAFGQGFNSPQVHVKPQCTLGFLFLYSILCCKRFEACWMNNKEDKNNDLFKNNLFDLGICWAAISMYDGRVTGMVHRLYRDCCLKIFPFGDESYCRSNRDDSISQMDVCSVG